MAYGCAGIESPVITTVFQRCVRKNGGDQETQPIRPGSAAILESAAGSSARLSGE